MDHQTFGVNIQDGYAIITINKPPFNALTIKNCLDLCEIVQELDKNEHVKVIIITGGIKFAFFTGSDLDEIYGIMKMEGDPSQNMIAASRPVQQAFTQIEQCSKVVIAAVNGITIGLGLELMLATDIRVCGDMAWFRMAQTGIGIIPGAGGTQRLPRLVGVAKAKEIIFTAKKINAREALEIGLVNQITEHGSELGEAVGIAAGIIKNASPAAVRLAKEAIHFSMLQDQQSGMDREMELLGRTYAGNDAFIGIERAMSKEKPVYN